jgi:hypothetical protein
MPRDGPAGLIESMPTPQGQTDFRHAKAGDRIEVRGLAGGPTRKGSILEILGRAGHEHYRVRWDDDTESIFFPADGAHVIHAKAQ